MEETKDFVTMYLCVTWMWCIIVNNKKLITNILVENVKKNYGNYILAAALNTDPMKTGGDLMGAVWIKRAHYKAQERMSPAGDIQAGLCVSIAVRA